MRHIGLASSAVCVAMLLGCSEAPVYKKPEMAVPAIYNEAVSIWQPAQPSDNQPRGEWWKLYGDVVLKDLVVRLDAANTDLAVAMAHFEQAAAYASQAQAGLFPTVSAGAFSARNRQSDTRALRSSTQPAVYGDNSAGLLADYEVDLWGRVRNLVDAGEAGAQAAAADFESVRLSLRAQLVNAYLTLRMLDAQSKLMSDEVASYVQALEFTRKRFAGGVDSALDMSRAQVQLDTAKAKLADIAAGRALYEHAIATLVGEPASGFSITPAVVNIQLPEIPVGVPSTLLQRRPDIAAAERRLFAANANVGVAKTAFFPKVSLTAAAGYESANQAGWLNAPNLFWSIGPSAFLTVFDAGRRKAAVAQAEAAYKAEGAQYRGAVLHAFQDVEDNLSLLNRLSEELTSLNDAINATHRTLDISMNRYREGVSSYLDVVTAQTLVQQVQLDEINVRMRRLQASVNLIRALGGGYDSTAGKESKSTTRSEM